MSLAELIHQRPTVGPSASVQDAVEVMTGNNLGAIPVVDRGKVVGIFTERDLMKRVVLALKDPARTPIRDVMTSPVQTIAATASLEEATAIMQDRHIRHLVVVDHDGTLRGVVGLRYLLNDLLASLERKLGDLESFVQTDGPGR